MNAQTTSIFPLSERTLLQRVLLGNATFSTFSGLIMILGSGPISRFLGLENPAILAATGILLLLFMPFLVWLARKSPVPQNLVWIVISLDVLWVIGSIILIFSSQVPLTAGGKWAVAITADVVTLFAILQYVGLRRQQRMGTD